MRKIYIAFFCFLLITNISRADQQIVSIVTHGETLISATVDKLVVRVKLRTHEKLIGKPSDPRPDTIDSNCTYSRYPCSIADRIDISVNGSSLFVPRSVFSDLADLNTASIALGDNDDVVLTLHGGDASESYIVKIDFDATRVKRRTLSSGMDPDHPLQETVYNSVVMGD